MEIVRKLKIPFLYIQYYHTNNQVADFGLKVLLKYLEKHSIIQSVEEVRVGHIKLFIALHHQCL